MIWALLTLLALAPVTAAATSDCPDCPDMRELQAGSFAMGTVPGGYEAVEGNGETPPVTIEITAPFAIARTEITQAQFAAFIAASGYQPAAQPCLAWEDGQWSVRGGRAWNRPADRSPAGDEPVRCVAWADAVAYADWLTRQSGRTYRLPSEAEWEYAARAGTVSPRYWGWDSFEGVSITRACDFANVHDIAGHDRHDLGLPWARCDDRHADVAPIGQFAPNPWGLLDMIGNVAEWTADCYTASQLNRPKDARPWVWDGGCEARVVRGGSWASRPLDARAAARRFRVADQPATDLGFRVVRIEAAADQPTGGAR